MSIETFPEAMLPSIIGTKNGETRFGPLPSIVSVPDSKVSMPPIPVPMRTPTRVGSAAMSTPDCATASRAATMASCEKRSIRRLSLRPIASAGSNPFNSPANLVSKPSASKRVIGAMPERPATAASQTAGTSLPIAQMAPMPVTTTWRSGAWVASR
jgi:hypothetical protein